MRTPKPPPAIDDDASASDVNVGVALLRHLRIATGFGSHVVWLPLRTDRAAR